MCFNFSLQLTCHRRRPWTWDRGGLNWPISPPLVGSATGRRKPEARKCSVGSGRERCTGPREPERAGRGNTPERVSGKGWVAAPLEVDWGLESDIVGSWTVRWGVERGKRCLQVRDRCSARVLRRSRVKDMETRKEIIYWSISTLKQNYCDCNSSLFWYLF